MEQYIKKSALVAEIERRIDEVNQIDKASYEVGLFDAYKNILSFLDTLEVIDPYELCVQYPSVKDAIQAHAETYSFNIESELFHQLTREQQELWRKEIEQAVISGGDAGYSLAKDKRYKENLEVKEVDLKAELNTWRHNHFHGGRDFEASGEYLERITQLELAKHFLELGLNSQRKISYVPNIDDSLKELGVDPDSKEAKIFKESYYTALEKLKAQKGD